VFITYLNKNWRSEYGGALELWDTDEDKFAGEVVPELAARFSTITPESLHGHPEPISEPNGRPRRSAAAYFYSNGRPDGDGSGFLDDAVFPNRATGRSVKKLG